MPRSWSPPSSTTHLIGCTGLSPMRGLLQRRPASSKPGTEAWIARCAPRMKMSQLRPSSKLLNLCGLPPEAATRSVASCTQDGPRSTGRVTHTLRFGMAAHCCASTEAATISSPCVPKASMASRRSSPMSRWAVHPVNGFATKQVGVRTRKQRP